MSEWLVVCIHVCFICFSGHYLPLKVHIIMFYTSLTCAVNKCKAVHSNGYCWFLLIFSVHIDMYSRSFKPILEHQILTYM